MYICFPASFPPQKSRDLQILKCILSLSLLLTNSTFRCLPSENVVTNKTLNYVATTLQTLFSNQTFLRFSEYSIITRNHNTVNVHQITDSNSNLAIDVTTQWLVRLNLGQMNSPNISLIVSNQKYLTFLGLFQLLSMSIFFTHT